MCTFRGYTCPEHNQWLQLWQACATTKARGQMSPQCLSWYDNTHLVVEQPCPFCTQRYAICFYQTHIWSFSNSTLLLPVSTLLVEPWERLLSLSLLSGRLPSVSTPVTGKPPGANSQLSYILIILGVISFRQHHLL